MRRWILLALATAGPFVAMAQPVSPQPGFQTAPFRLMPPDGPQGAAMPAPPAGQPSLSEPAAVSPEPPGSDPAHPAPTWLARDTATLQALDKVNAQSAPVTVKAGQAASFGSMTIELRACMVRPPDQPQDAAAFVTVTDSRPDAPRFSGWLLRSAPAVSMLEDPIYDLRLIACGG
jgi:hypothetical protein